MKIFAAAAALASIAFAAPAIYQESQSHQDQARLLSEERQVLRDAPNSDPAEMARLRPASCEMQTIAAGQEAAVTLPAGGDNDLWWFPDSHSSSMFSITGYRRGQGVENYTLHGLKKGQTGVWFKLIRETDENGVFGTKCFALNIE